MLALMGASLSCCHGLRKKRRVSIGFEETSISVEFFRIQADRVVGPQRYGDLPGAPEKSPTSFRRLRPRRTALQLHPLLPKRYLIEP